MKKFDYKTELLYEQYMCISADAHHEKIRFYESKIAEILIMPFDRCIEVRLDYVFSLYMVGAYTQYIRKVEALINIVIEENIYKFRGKDVYRELLFLKAISHYRNIEFREANYLFKALLRIDGNDKEAERAYYKCKLDELRSKSQTSRGLSIVIFLLLGLFTAFDLLIIRSFYSQWSEVSNWIKVLLLGSGLALLIYNEIRIRRIAKSISQAKEIN